MKCHKCGCENKDDYQFCRNCGAPRKDKINRLDPTAGSGKKVKIDPISGPNPSNSIFNKRTILLGVTIIAIVAVLAIAVNSLNFGGVSAGNEAIINVNENSFESSGKMVYGISFTLTNAPDVAKTYYGKVIWYDDSGEEVLSTSESLEYATIDEDNTMDIYISASSKNTLNISKCMIEITDNQGQLVTSTSHEWKDY